MNHENKINKKRKYPLIIINFLRILIEKKFMTFMKDIKKHITNKFKKNEENNWEKTFLENMFFKKILQKQTISKIKIFLSDRNSIITFPKYKKPKISIIIITFNKVFYTFRCLESIKAFADIPYEIVLVDNGSKDETIALLNRLRNVKIIKNPKNMGFVKACNQASKIARGKFLLFLNNDTEILPNCFSNLVKTIENNKKCGAVGARLIFPNGKLQEAGAIILNDGLIQEYGNNDAPLKPEYSYVRDVDFCAGACLLIKSDLFSKFGGFDEIYSPGYYEECDFCVQLRKNGHTILYQPTANAVHYFLGSSSGINAVHKLGTKNCKKFKKKWENTLKKELHQNKLENTLFTRDKSKKMRILIIDDRLPTLRSGTNHPRMYELMHMLSDLGQITFLPLQEPRQIQPETDYFQQMGMEIIYYNILQKKEYIKNFLTQRKWYYDIIVLSKTNNTHKLLPVIKQMCNKSDIIYDYEIYEQFKKNKICKR